MIALPFKKYTYFTNIWFYTVHEDNFIQLITRTFVLSYLKLFSQP